MPAQGVYRTIAVAPIAGALGAEITGVDLATDLRRRDGGRDPAGVARASRRVLPRPGARARRSSSRSPAASANRSSTRSSRASTASPRSSRSRSCPHETVNFGGIWHSDTVYLERPPMATMLIAREVPPSGGDTMFANMYAAYDALSPGLQRLLERSARGEQLGARRRLEDARGPHPRQRRRRRDREYVAEHPVVRTHPETGRKALYVNVAHTLRFVDMTEDESRPLLQYLFEHSVRPEFTCRFQWQVGSLALWDNRCAMHNPINDYHGYTRAMHRITLAGDVPPDVDRAQRGHVADDSRDGPRRGARRFGDAEAVVDGDRRVDFADAARPGRRRGARARSRRASSAATGSRCGRRTRSSGSSPRSASRPPAACSSRSTPASGRRGGVHPRAQRRPRALHRARVPRHRLPGAARERRRRRSRRSSTRSCSPATPTTRAIAWDDFLARGDARDRRPTSTRASRRSAPTIRATSCSRRARPAARRAS